MKNKKSNKNIYPYVVGVIPLSEIGKLPGTPIGLPAYIDYDELYEARMINAASRKLVRSLSPEFRF